MCQRRCNIGRWIGIGGTDRIGYFRIPRDEHLHPRGGQDHTCPVLSTKTGQLQLQGVIRNVSMQHQDSLFQGVDGLRFGSCDESYYADERGLVRSVEHMLYAWIKIICFGINDKVTITIDTLRL